MRTSRSTRSSIGGLAQKVFLGRSFVAGDPDLSAVEMTLIVILTFSLSVRMIVAQRDRGGECHDSGGLPPSVRWSTVPSSAWKTLTGI